MSEGMTSKLHFEVDQGAEVIHSAAVSANETDDRPQEEADRKIRIAIVDDHPIVRDGLRKLLDLEDDIEVIAEAENGRQALEVVEDLQPDVLLLDLKMPGMDGLTALQTLQHTQHKTKIIVLTAS